MPNFLRIIIHLIVIFKKDVNPSLSIILLFIDINIIRNFNDFILLKRQPEDYVYKTYSTFLAFSNRFINILILLENSDVKTTRLFPLFIFSDFFSLIFSTMANVYIKKQRLKNVENMVAGIDQRQESAFDKVIETYIAVYFLFYFWKVCASSTSDLVAIAYVLSIPAFIVTFLIKILETAYGFWYIVQEDKDNQNTS